MNVFQNPKFRKILIVIFALICLLGIFYRFYNITDNDFYLYDEGYYLNFNYKWLQLIDLIPPKNMSDFLSSAYAVVRFSLGTGKALWFMIVDARVFFGLLDHWYFPRLVSALAGVLTLLITYRFASKYYQSNWVGWLSAATLAILPGHVYYSRLGIQEALCILLFTSGMYFYIFPKRHGWRTFLSAALLAGAYFTNYRLIVLPMLIAAIEMYHSFSLKKWPDYRKYIWHTVIFLFLVFGIGSLDRAQNIIVTYSWMFYQRNLADKNPFDIVNLFSYPYCLFRLEGILFGLGFFGNVYWLKKKEWGKALPFLIVCCLMAGFSLADEKGARYIAVGLPLACASVAALTFEYFSKQSSEPKKIVVCVVFALMLLEFLPKTVPVVQMHSDYRQSYEDILRKDPKAKILSSQNYVQNLYAPKRSDVLQLPHSFDKLMEIYAQGYRYMIIGPQAYISYTDDKQRFNPKLKTYLGFIRKNIKPVQTYDHFDDYALARFVMEHNANLRQSVKFLSMKDKGFGRLYIYDMKEFMVMIMEKVFKKK